MMGILEYAGQVIVYSLLAAAVLEALLRAWRVKNPFLAVRFRLLTLAVPPVAPLLFYLLSQHGELDEMRQQVALLDLRNWLGAGPDLSHPGMDSPRLARWPPLRCCWWASRWSIWRDRSRPADAGAAARRSTRNAPGRPGRLEAGGLEICPVLAVPRPGAPRLRRWGLDPGRSWYPRGCWSCWTPRSWRWSWPMRWRT